MTRTLLGKITFTVYEVGPNGELTVEHETTACPVLEAMQGAMSNEEKHKLAAIRSEISRGAAIFFAQWQQPENTMGAVKR